MESESGSEPDDAIAALELFKRIMPKIELVLKELDRIDPLHK